MTNNATEHILNELRNAGKLVPFEAKLDGDQSEVRRIWTSPDLHAWLYEEGLPRHDLEYRAKVRANLTVFVRGDKIDNCDYLKLLKPYENDIWEIKNRFEPKRHSRIFGALLMKDFFIATNWSWRDNPKWDESIAKAIAIWDDIFKGRRRYRCRPFANCVTGGIDLCQK